MPLISIAKIAEDSNGASMHQALLGGLSACGVIVTDRNGKITEWNDAATRIYGYTRDEVVGKTTTLIHAPDQIPQLANEIVATVARENCWSGEISFVHKDGTFGTTHTIVMASRDDDGELTTVGINRDLGATKPVHEALTETIENLRLVTDDVGANITYLDTDQRYRFVNKEFAESLGLTPDQLIGKFAREFQTEEMRDRAAPYIDAALGGETVNFERNRRGLDGSTRTFQATYRPHFDDCGEILGVIGLSVDITERKRTETELKRATQAADLLRTVASAANHEETPEAAIKVALDEVCGYSGWPIGHAYLFDDSGSEELTSSGLWHLDQESRFEPFRQATNRIKFQPGIGLPGHVASEITSRWHTAIERNHEVERSQKYLRVDVAASVGIETGFAIPVMVGHQVAAVLEFFTDQIIERDEELLSIAEQVGVLLGRVIERKRAVSKLEKTNSAAELLRNIAFAANNTDDPAEAIQVSLNLLCAYAGWPIGHAYILSADHEDQLVSTNLWYLENIERHQIFRSATENKIFGMGVGLPGMVASEGTPHWLTELSIERNFPRADVADTVGIKTGFAIPVMVGLDVEAVLEFYSSEIVKRDENLLSIAAQVGMLIGRVIERQRTALVLTVAKEEALRAKEETETASRSKSEFLANMSHELRTPLNSIIGFSDLLTDPSLYREEHMSSYEYATHIYDSGEHLLALINDILDISKIETGTSALLEEDVEIPPIVSRCVTMLAERAKNSDVELVVDIAEGSLPTLRADARRLKQVMLNLMTNSVKFTEPGGIIIVKASFDRDEGFILQVVDTGIGIAAQDIPIAFARFQQVDGDLSRKNEGTGLGLPLAKALIEQHGGTIDLQSQLGVGTTISVHLPAERAVLVDNFDA